LLDAGIYMVPAAQWGFTSSPVIFEDRVYVQCDIQGKSFVAAFDAETGEDVWRTERDEVPTWGTPTVDVSNGRRQLICNGWRHIGGYDLDTGKELWKLEGGGDIPVPTPIVAHDLIFITNAHGRSAPVYAIDAAAEGQAVGLDVYPYTASSTVLLADHAAEATDVLIAASEPHPEAAGRWLRDLVAEWGCGQAEAIERLRPAGAIYFQMADEDLERILAYPRTMVGSDGLPGMAHPHPRLWGTFPRVLGRYVRDKGLLSLEQAVHKMTGLPARTYRLVDRGLIQPGYFADLTVFDPATIVDRATYDDPERPADGIRQVLVNGTPVWASDGTTGQRPGRFLARAEGTA